MATLILNRPVIGVTGSAGKTTTKEMIAAVLGTRWKVFKNKYNYNVLNSTRRHARTINSTHEAVVLEYGMAAPGFIRQHCKIIQPNIGVVTNVGSAHIGNFGGSIERLAAAKSELIRNMKASGLLIINADDYGSKWLQIKNHKGQIVSVGIDHDATYRARHIRYTHGGMQFEAYFHQEWHEVFIPILGRHNVYNALMAIAVGDLLDLTPPEIVTGLKKMYLNHRRVHVHSLGNGVTLIDDSYSANPHAVKAAIDVLMNVGGGQRIIVLGEMRELGSHTQKGHREVGAYVARSGVDYFLTLGPRTRHASQEALKAGMPADQIKHFNSRSALHGHLLGLIKEQSTILIKGSHSSEMFITADFLRKRGKSRTNKQKRTHRPYPNTAKKSKAVSSKRSGSRPRPRPKVTTNHTQARRRSVSAVST